MRSLADGVFLTNEDVEGLTRGNFTKPGLEVVEQFSNGLDATVVKKFWLRKKTGNTRDIELISNSRETEIPRQLNERINGSTNCGISTSLGIDANLENTSTALGG